MPDPDKPEKKIHKGGGGGKRFMRRDASGRFTQSEDAGRSLSQDVRQEAKKGKSKNEADKAD